MLATLDTAAMQTAVADYFSGEQREMLLIVAGSALFTGMAAWLWIFSRSAFAAAFAITVIAIAALLTATAGSLLVRDKGLVAKLAEGFAGQKQAKILSAERSRIEIVVSKYRYYRYAVSAIGALCLLGLALTQRGWVHGTAAGLLLLVAAQVAIDHFSEVRARKYLLRLPVVAAATTPPNI